MKKAGVAHPYLIICELCELCEQMCRLSIFSGKCLCFSGKNLWNGFQICIYQKMFVSLQSKTISWNYFDSNNMNGHWQWQEKGNSWRGVGIYHVTASAMIRHPQKAAFGELKWQVVDGQIDGAYVKRMYFLTAHSFAWCLAAGNCKRWPSMWSATQSGWLFG